MYLPEHFAETDTQALHALIRACPLASVVVAEGDTPMVNHLPLLLGDAEPGAVRLRGHVARSNPLWRLLGVGRAAVAVFHGPQGYVTPSWYRSKQEHGRVVPTWNYAVVHAHGVLCAIDDPGWVESLVRELTATHEGRREAPWRVDDAPQDFFAQQLRAIVGIELTVSRLEGKFKLSQNRAAADRAGVIAGTEAELDHPTRALGRLMHDREEG